MSLQPAGLPVAAGIGLRAPHHDEVTREPPPVAWLEVHPENYMGGGLAPALLERIRADRPISLHGVGLSIGSATGLDQNHLRRLAELADRIDPPQMSEHLSWSIADGAYLGDLLPLPLTEEALDVACANVNQMQETLRRRVLIENPSTYLRWQHSTIAEPEFLAALAARTGCGLLCDVNNIVVSAHNHDFDPLAYLRALPGEAIGEIHVAGHSLHDVGNGRIIRLDDHGSHVSAEVWALVDHALALFGPKPILVEWDTGIPELPVLLAEAALAQQRIDRVSRHAHAA